MKKSIRSLQTFHSIGSQYVSNFDKIHEKVTPDHIKLKYAIKKIVKAISKTVETAKDDERELRLSKCLLDDDGCIKKDEDGNFMFKKEKLREVEKGIKKINEKEVDVKPHYVSRVDASTLPFNTTILEGFVYKELTEEEELKLLSEVK